MGSAERIGYVLGVVIVIAFVAFAVALISVGVSLIVQVSSALAELAP